MQNQHSITFQTSELSEDSAVATLEAIARSGIDEAIRVWARVTSKVVSFDKIASSCGNAIRSEDQQLTNAWASTVSLTGVGFEWEYGDAEILEDQIYDQGWMTLRREMKLMWGGNKDGEEIASCHQVVKCRYKGGEKAGGYREWLPSEIQLEGSDAIIDFLYCLEKEDRRNAEVKRFQAIGRFPTIRKLLSEMESGCGMEWPEPYGDIEEKIGEVVYRRHFDSAALEWVDEKVEKISEGVIDYEEKRKGIREVQQQTAQVIKEQSIRPYRLGQKLDGSHRAVVAGLCLSWASSRGMDISDLVSSRAGIGSSMQAMMDLARRGKWEGFDEPDEWGDEEENALLVGLDMMKFSGWAEAVRESLAMENAKIDGQMRP